MPAPEWFHPFDLADIGNLRRVSLPARWVMVELFGGELGEKHGLVQVRPALIASECDMKPADVDKSLTELEAARLIVYDRANRLAYHSGCLLRHNPGTNEKHRAGWVRQLSAMADGVAKSAALSELDSVPYGTDTSTVTVTNTEAIDSLSAAYRQPNDSQPSRDNQKTTRFKPPTEQEATTFFATVGGNASMAEDFVLFYAGKGWLVGKSPMKDWTMAARRWAKGNGASGQPLVQLGLATIPPSSVPMGKLKDGTLAPLIHANGNILQANGYYAPAHLAVNPQEAIR